MHIFLNLSLNNNTDIRYVSDLKASSKTGVFYFERLNRNCLCARAHASVFYFQLLFARERKRRSGWKRTEEVRWKTSGHEIFDRLAENQTSREPRGCGGLQDELNPGGGGGEPFSPIDPSSRYWLQIRWGKICLCAYFN